MDTFASAPIPGIRLIQFRQGGQMRVGLVKDAEIIQLLAIQGGTYELARQAIQKATSVADIVEPLKGNEQLSYQGLIEEGSLLPPITHPDPAHCCVSGTGLTHLGSAGTRDSMH